MPWVYDLTYGWVWVPETAYPYYTQVPYYQPYTSYHYWTPLPQPSKLCRYCGESLVWVPSYQRWWCTKCLKYR